ncbi:MAG: TetR/AcrR family transcriptional regulator [Rhodobacteraceae bacterium]|jgi:AcrR family transcriptional regulator|nr:TetR/AcrR family transcriptional regulator [Paracoccaceae bacterium]
MAPLDEPPLSGTERGKRDKARRIREASRAMFLTKGFEDATIRDIARMAEVAQGTLFLYASSKRDLLFMLYNDLIEGACDECETIPVAQLSLTETLLRITVIHLHRITDDLGIARLSISNLNLYDKSSESLRFSQLYGRMLALISGEMRRRQAKGRLRADFEVELIATMAFTVLIEMFKVYLRSDLPDIRRVLQQTHDQLAVILRGLNAAPDELDIRDPDLRDLVALPIAVRRQV